MSFRFVRKRRAAASRGPVSLGQSLGRMIEKLGIEVRLAEHRAVLVWSDVVGPEISRVTEPARVKSGCLSVHVKTAPWRHALMFRREEIRKALNNRLGEDLVKRIVLR